MVTPPRADSLPGYRFRIPVGGVLTVFGFIWLLMCIGFAFDPKMRNGLVANVVFSLLMLLPGLALYLSGGARRAREARMNAAADFAIAAGRVPVAELAQSLRFSPDQARQALLDAVGTGRIAGRLDVERGIFTRIDTADAGAPRELAFVCRACGASSTVLVMPGAPPRCGYCGATN